MLFLQRPYRELPGRLCRFSTTHILSSFNHQWLNAMAEAPGLAGVFSLSSQHCVCVVTHLHHSVSVIAVHCLTGSLINTCYDYQLHTIRNASKDLKLAIKLLRSLNDVFHRLYMAVNGHDPNGCFQSPLLSIIGLITENGPLVQCTVELQVLETVLETGDWPLKGMALTRSLANLDHIKVALDADKRFIHDSCKYTVNVPFPQDYNKSSRLREKFPLVHNMFYMSSMAVD